MASGGVALRCRKGADMSKKMTFRKKGLALILCLMIATAALSGCEKDGKTESDDAEESEELDIPDVSGKNKTVGAFTLLVPKGMDAEEGDTESEVTLTDDDENYILLQVYDKKEAKNHIKELQEENEKLKEESFTINGISWSGVSNKKEFCVYGKVGGKTVLVSSEGFKLMDDIPLAVLASLEVDEDAEAVSGGGSSSGSKVAEVAGGIYTVEYSKAYKEGDYSECLESVNGSAEVYLSYFSNGSSISQTLRDFEDYDYEEIKTADGMTGYLYSNDYSTYYIVPFDSYYEKDYMRIAGVYIFTYGDEDNAELQEAFRDLCRSVKVNPDYCTDEGVESVSDEWEEYWDRGWYGWYIVYDGDGKYKDDISWSYDCLAEFQLQGDNEVRMVLAQDDIDSYTIDANFVHYNDSTEMGYLVSECGELVFPDTDGSGKLNNWILMDIGDTDIMFDPEYDSYTLDEYLTFSMKMIDDDGDAVTLKGFLRPWGTDWEDIRQLNQDELPEIVTGKGPSSYDDMFPINYSDWYEDIMYDDFPGIWGLLD